MPDRTQREKEKADVSRGLMMSQRINDKDILMMIMKCMRKWVTISTEPTTYMLGLQVYILSSLQFWIAIRIIIIIVSFVTVI